LTTRRARRPALRAARGPRALVPGQATNVVDRDVLKVSTATKGPCTLSAKKLKAALTASSPPTAAARTSKARPQPRRPSPSPNNGFATTCCSGALPFRGHRDPLVRRLGSCAHDLSADHMSGSFSPPIPLPIPRMAQASPWARGGPNHEPHTGSIVRRVLASERSKAKALIPRHRSRLPVTRKTDSVRPSTRANPLRKRSPPQLDPRLSDRPL